MLPQPILHQKVKSYIPICISLLTAAGWALGTQLIPANVYQLHVGLGMLLGSLVISYFLFAKFNWLVGLGYLYFSLNSIPRITFPALSWPNAIPDPGVMVGFESMVESAYIYLTLIVLSFYFLRKHLKNIEDFFLCLAFIDSVVLCCKFIYFLIKKAQFNDYWYYFVMNNASIDGAFIACCLPLAFARAKNDYQSKTVLAFMILPCVFTYSSSGMLGLGLAVGMYIWAKNKFSLSATIYGGAASLAVAMIGWLIQREALITTTGRAHIWKLALKWFFQNDSKLFGTGAGTWYMMGPALQMNEAMGKGADKIDAFFWMHNDWLQVGFEMGLIGLAIAFTLWVYLIIKARKVPKIFASLVVIGCLAIAQMPLRHFILTIMIGFLMTYSVCPPTKPKPNKT